MSVISIYLRNTREVTVVLLLLSICTAFTGKDFSWASADFPEEVAPVTSRDEPETPQPWYKKLETRWGGHIKVQGSVSWIGGKSVFQPVGTGRYYDGDIQGRLKNGLFLGDWGQFDTHYEHVLSGGDTRSKTKELEMISPGLFREGLITNPIVEDDRRFLDLTKAIHEDDDCILYHRLDRLYFTWLPKGGVVRIGRQAVTWGNGLLFNPLDLFNPFSPTDIERDYKIGDDMVFTQWSIKSRGDFQTLYIPRRDPSNGNVEWNESSLAGKLHVAWETTEFDIMGAHHYDDGVVGLGSTGYLGDAAWRLDVTWTFLDENGDYVSLVANVDYSWVWWEKNFYGFLEFFYNALGNNQYKKAFTDPEIRQRLERGELSVLGRTYLSGHLQVELHPLLNFSFTVINNLADPSGVLQPRITWDVTQDFQVTVGGYISYGPRGTEFGGFRIPGTNYITKAPDSAFLWLTYFF